MKRKLQSLGNYVKAHKFLSIIILLVIIGIAYWIIKSVNTEGTVTTYVAGKVRRGEITTTVSGTGQVSALSQVDLKTKAAGDLIYLNAKVGQEVFVGSLIARLDSGDASYEAESARIAYDDLITIDPDDLRKAENDVVEAEKAVSSAYIDAGVAIIKSSTDLGENLESIYGLLGDYLSTSKYGLSQTAKEMIREVNNKYVLANKAHREYVKVSLAYPDKNDRDTIESLSLSLQKVSLLVLDTTKLTKETVVYLREREDEVAVAAEAYSTVNALAVSVSETVSSLSANDKNINSANQALSDAKITLADLKDGPDSLDLRNQELSLKQKNDALADYSVTVPFAGVIASVGDVVVGDTVSNGTTVATLITKQKQAEISLNEIDAAKVKVGQKAELTFDAIDGLDIAGTVSEVNLIGTVSQGVVSYTVKIGLDSQDERIKSGMSVSAAIVTESKSNVLMVPNAAIKNRGDNYYVEIPGQLATDVPTQKTVTIGVSNDTFTEILSGVDEGEAIVVKTNTGTATASAPKTASVSSILSGNRTGGANRMAR
jgi:HlyD family secretion protein